jgi:hypothetical protein
LNKEFEHENNGLFGVTPSGNFYVSCKHSWFNLHNSFLNRNYHLRNTNPQYFKKFYKPELRKPANQIQESIDRNQVDPLFKRIDDPFHLAGDKTLHGEQIQMHFNDDDKSALNIDGTWKHKKFDLPNRIKDQLIEWGFVLPD